MPDSRDRTMHDLKFLGVYFSPPADSGSPVCWTSDDLVSSKFILGLSGVAAQGRGDPSNGLK